MYIIFWASTDHEKSGKYANSNTAKCLLSWLFVNIILILSEDISHINYLASADIQPFPFLEFSYLKRNETRLG